MSLNLKQLGTILNAVSSKIKSSRGNWNQNDPNADDYIKNRTHYEAYEDFEVEKPLIITWYGNTDGKVQATSSESGEVQPIFKISDEILTEEQFKQSVCTAMGTSLPLIDMWEDGLANGYIICREDITAFMDPPLCIVREDNVELNGFVFPEKGVYSFSEEGFYFSRIATTYHAIEKRKVVHHLDPKYIKDMYYVDEENVESKTIVSENLDMSSSNHFNTSCLLVEGKKYHVSVNGDKYECVAWYYSNWGAVVLGSARYLGGDSLGDDSPFAIDSYDDGNIYFNTDNYGTYSITISEEIPIIHPIDEKYIPDTIARLSDLVVLDGGGSPMQMSGLYTRDYELIADWDTLTKVNGIDFEKDNLKSALNTDPTTLIYHIYDTYGNFAGDQNMSLLLPEGLKHIGNNLLYECSTVGEVVIPSSVETIGEHAFCNSSSEIIFRENSKLTEIGDELFKYSDMSNIVIPRSVARIGRSAFANNYSLKNLCFEENSSLQTIDYGAFENDNSLSTANLENAQNLQTIEDRAFYSTHISEWIIPASVTSIGYYSFAQNYSLTSLHFNENSSLQIIEEGAFTNCPSLSSVNLEMAQNLHTIGRDAFRSANISTITIPASVTSIGSNAFYCSNLKEVVVLATTPPSLSGLIVYNTSDVVIKVPASSVDAYKNAAHWYRYNIVPIEE